MRRKSEPRIKNGVWRKDAYAMLVARDGERCSICKAPAGFMWRPNGEYQASYFSAYPHTRVRQTSTLEVEHIVALCDGGDHGEANLHLVCFDCHRLKSASEAVARREEGARPL